MNKNKIKGATVFLKALKEFVGKYGFTIDIDNALGKSYIKNQFESDNQLIQEQVFEITLPNLVYSRYVECEKYKGE